MAGRPTMPTRERISINRVLAERAKCRTVRVVGLLSRAGNGAWYLDGEDLTLRTITGFIVKGKRMADRTAYVGLDLSALYAYPLRNLERRESEIERLLYFVRELPRYDTPRITR